MVGGGGVGLGDCKQHDAMLIKRISQHRTCKSSVSISGQQLDLQFALVMTLSRHLIEGGKSCRFDTNATSLFIVKLKHNFYKDVFWHHTCPTQWHSIKGILYSHHKVSPYCSELRLLLFDWGSGCG